MSRWPGTPQEGSVIPALGFNGKEGLLFTVIHQLWDLVDDIDTDAATVEVCAKLVQIFNMPAK